MTTGTGDIEAVKDHRPIPLNQANLSRLAPDVQVPAYARQRLARSIVHIGVGGFHRAHQAVYVDDLCRDHGITDWGVCGVGLLAHDTRIRDALHAQDCLYTLVERSAAGDRARVIGSITEFLFAPDDPDAVIEKMASGDTRIVSLTITEGGYYIDQGSGAFQEDHPDIVHDLAHPDRPTCAFGYLLEALARRRQRGMRPFTVLSCDNVQGNGDVTRKVLLRFAELRDPALKDWLAEHGAFPNCMVDRITPATTDTDRALVRETFGIEDAWPVVCEPFRQWVIEDHFCNGRPPFEKVGVQMTADVQPYETMKLRLLNASHSAMGYLGYLAGYGYIYEIMADPRFRQYILDLMNEEITPVLQAVPGVDLDEYKQTLVERFANPTVRDQATRICLDGSAKIPKFILPTIREQLARGGSVRRLSLAVASWCRFLAGTDEQGRPIEIQDPMAEALHRHAKAAGRDPRPFLGMREIFGDDLPQSSVFVEEVSKALRHLYDDGAMATLERTLRAP
jgi:mannitol 2-dehydrogenase